MLLTSTLSALWLATFAWGAVQADEDNVKSIGVRLLARRGFVVDGSTDSFL